MWFPRDTRIYLVPVCRSALPSLVMVYLPEELPPPPSPLSLGVGVGVGQPVMYANISFRRVHTPWGREGSDDRAWCRRDVEVTGCHTQSTPFAAPQPLKNVHCRRIGAAGNSSHMASSAGLGRGGGNSAGGVVFDELQWEALSAFQQGL